MNISLIITAIFLGVVISYYFLLFKDPKRYSQIPGEKQPNLVVIIPAHNEETYIRECLDSVVEAKWNGNKQIIVIDDGSTDRTASIVKEYSVTLIKTPHLGKAAALNKALANSSEEHVAVVDADSIITRDALLILEQTLAHPELGAVTSVIKVKNRRYINFWAHIEQLYNSLIRSLLAKAGANVSIPGPLGMYKRKALEAIGGFSEQGFSEDLDIGIRLQRKGYNIGFAPAVVETYLPSSPMPFLKQRIRFCRGMIFLLRNHIAKSWHVVDLYTLPLFLFGYMQAVIMGSTTIIQLTTQYSTYFASKGIYMNASVVLFLLEWFSIIGTAKWTIGLFTGTTPITPFNMIGVAATLLSYPLFIVAIIRYDREISWKHLLPLCFMFPFWLIHMAVATLCLPEIFRKHQYNRWAKNEKKKSVHQQA